LGNLSCLSSMIHLTTPFTWRRWRWIWREGNLNTGRRLVLRISYISRVMTYRERFQKNWQIFPA
jgi:hypothetical protein